MKPSQHDAHCDALDQHLWDRWEQLNATRMTLTHDAAPVTTEVTAEDAYVIASSDSIEQLYWKRKEGNTPGRWVPLVEATQFTIEEVHRVGSNLQIDGFWMPMERARELED